jgi:hypothetical protein
MASKQLKSAIRNVALCDVKSSDILHLREQFLLPPGDEISNDGMLGEWSRADEIALKREIFQFLRNLEAQPRHQRRIFH